MIRRTVEVVLAGTLALGSVAHADAGPGQPWPAVHEYEPSAALSEAAAKHRIAVAGIDVGVPSDSTVTDDVVVCLVVLDARGRRTEWLVEVRGPSTAPASPHGATVLYLADGRAIRFESRQARLSIRALGPHRPDRPGEAIPLSQASAEMNTAFLGESMLRAADFIYRAGRARFEGRLKAEDWFSVLNEPPARPDPDLRARFVQATGMSEADERAVAASVPALNEFAQVIAVTPGLREVLFSVARKPSLWSIASRFGRVETDFRFRSGEVVPASEPPLGFPGLGPCFIVPFTFSIQDRAALECTMLVVEPRRPLRLCAGVVALVAQAPDVAESRLILRVIAAHAAAGESAAP